MASSSLVFKVRRSEAVLVKPARPTPIEVKPLSDWDNRTMLRQRVPVILFYKHSEAATNKDPAETIKKALAEALVYYYPWAGRLKEGSDSKLVVDCTGEGVVFVEADADVKLNQLAHQPPFPCFKELLYDTEEPLEHAPLFTMQVTRLLCGGFILAFTFSHTISDGAGANQFLADVAELANGAPSPSVLPIWQREIFLKAHEELPHAPLHNNNNVILDKTMPRPLVGDVDCTYGTFFFGSREVASIRARVPERLRESCTSFELIVACILHCRVTTLQHGNDEQVRVLFPVNCRSKFVNRPIPPGYYGNVSFQAMFICPMQDLHDLGCAVEKVQKTKEAMNQDHAQSMLDISVMNKGSVPHSYLQECITYSFNDWSKLGFSTLDFQPWGKPRFVGNPCDGMFRHTLNFMVAYKNQKGEEGRLLTLYMSKHAMDKFSIALSTLLGSH